MSIHKETTIVFNDTDPMATIWSASKSFERRMDKLGLDGKTYAGGIMWDIPKSMVKIFLPREFSDDQRIAAGIRLRMGRQCR